MAFLGAHNNDPMQLDNLDEEKELTITKINFPKQQEYNNNKQNNNLFSQLPDEIIQFHIIPLLDVLSLGFSFLPLNKKYFHLADSNEIWRERFFRALPKSQHEAFKKNAVLWRYAYSSELLAQATSSSSGSSSNHAGVLSEDEMVDSGKNGNNNSGIGVNSSGNGSNDVIYNEQAINFKELYKTLFVQGRFAGHRFLNSGNYKRDQYSHHITYFYLIDLFKNNYSENSSSLSQQNTAIGPSNSQQSSLQQLSRFSTLTTNNNNNTKNNNFNQNHNNANNFLLDNYKCIDMIFNQTIWPSIELFKGRTRERTALEDEESKEYYAVNGIVMGMYFVMFQEWMSNDLRAHVIGRKLVYKKNNTTINNNNRNNLIRNVNVLDDIGIDQNKKDDISVVIHGVWSDNKERCGLFTSENVDWNTTNFDLTILGTKLHDINYKRLYDLENEIKMFSKLTAFRNWQMTTFTKYNNNNQSTSLFDNYYNNNNQHNQQPFIVKNEYQVTFDCDTYMRGEAILKNSTIISQSNVSSSNNMNQQQQQNNQQQQGQHFQIIGNVLDNYVSFNLLNRGEHLFLAWCEFDNATNTTANTNNNHLFNTSTTRSSFNNNGFDEKGNNEFSRLSVNANRLMELTTIPTIPLTGMPSTSANLGGPSSLMMNGGAPSSSHGRYSSLSLRRSSVASIGSSSSSSNNNTFNGGSKLLRRKSCFGKSNNNLNENVAIQPKDCKLSGFLMDRNGIKGYLVLEPVSSIVTLNNNSNNVTTIHSLP